MITEQTRKPGAATRAGDDDYAEAARPAPGKQTLVGASHGDEGGGGGKLKSKGSLDAHGGKRQISRAFGPLTLSGSVGIKIPEEVPPEEEAVKIAEVEREIDVDIAKVGIGITAAQIESPKVAIPIDGYPDLVVQATASALSGSIDVDGNGDFKVEMKALAVGIKVSGKSKRGLAEVTWDLSGKLELGPEEVAKLYKALRTSKTVTEGLREGAAARKELRFAEKYLVRLREWAAGAKSAKQRARFLASIEKYEEIVARNSQILRRAGVLVSEHLEILRGLGEGMAMRAGRIASKIAAHALVKTVGKWLGRLVPVVGWGMAVVDLITLASEIVRVLSASELTWGDPDAAKGKGGKTGEGGGGEGDDGGSGGEGGVIGDAPACEPGDGPTGGAATGDERIAEPMPAISAAAQRVLDVIPGTTRSAMTAADIETLNAMVPSDVTDAELKQLIARLAAKGTPSDPITAVGRIRAELDAIRSGSDAPRYLVDGVDRPDVLAKARAELATGAKGATGGDKAGDDGDKDGGGTKTAGPGGDAEHDGDETGHAVGGITEPPPGLALVLSDPRALFELRDGALVWKAGARAAATKVYPANDGLGLRVLGMELASQEQRDGKPLHAVVEVTLIEVLKATASEGRGWIELGEQYTQSFELDFAVDDQPVEELIDAGALADCVTFDPATEDWYAVPDATLDIGTATVAVEDVDLDERGVGNSDDGAMFERFQLVLVPTAVNSPPTRVMTTKGLVTLELGVPVKVPITVRRP